MYNCPTFFLFWKCLDDMSYWTNLYRTVADNELHFFTHSNLNYTVFVSLAHIMYVCIMCMHVRTYACMSAGHRCYNYVDYYYILSMYVGMYLFIYVH